MHSVWNFVLVLGHMERLLLVSQVTDGKNLLQAIKNCTAYIKKKNYLLAQGIIDQVEYESKVCVIIKTLALKLEIFLCEG